MTEICLTPQHFLSPSPKSIYHIPGAKTCLGTNGNISGGYRLHCPILTLILKGFKCIMARHNICIYLFPPNPFRAVVPNMSWVVIPSYNSQVTCNHPPHLHKAIVIVPWHGSSINAAAACPPSSPSTDSTTTISDWEKKRERTSTMGQAAEGHCGIQGGGNTFMQRGSPSETSGKLSLHGLQKR